MLPFIDVKRCIHISITGLKAVNGLNAVIENYNSKNYVVLSDRYICRCVLFVNIYGLIIVCVLDYRFKIQRLCLAFFFTVLDTKLIYYVSCNKDCTSRKYPGVLNSNLLFVLKSIIQQNIISLYRSNLFQKIHGQFTKESGIQLQL